MNDTLNSHKFLLWSLYMVRDKPFVVSRCLQIHFCLLTSLLVFERIVQIGGQRADHPFALYGGSLNLTASDLSY